MFKYITKVVGHNYLINSFRVAVGIFKCSFCNNSCHIGGIDAGINISSFLYAGNLLKLFHYFKRIGINFYMVFGIKTMYV